MTIVFLINICQKLQKSADFLKYMSLFHRGHILLIFCFSRKWLNTHALLCGLITEFAFSRSQASGLYAYPVLLFLHTAYYEPEVYTGVALSEIRREMCARKCGCVCVPIHTCACVGRCVYMQSYYSYLTECTLSSKSAGRCNKGVYLSLSLSL